MMRLQDLSKHEISTLHLGWLKVFLLTAPA